MKLFEIYSIFLTAGALTMLWAGGYYLLISPFIKKEIDEYLRRTIVVQILYVVCLLALFLIYYFDICTPLVSLIIVFDAGRCA